MLTPKNYLLVLFLCLTSFALQAYPSFEEEAIKARIDSLESQVVSPRYDKVVRSYLMTYTIRGREKSERILGRRLMYFPIFEEYLKKYQLPEDLKYLPVVESALEPRAVSVAGAVGLWQFMSETGRYYGLEINNQVDERCDPHKSTDAAMRYLSQLHNRFNDWELAIAAYNSGGGRVSRAMKRARSKNFWRVKRYLPRETRNYVPAFIAATYLLKHYDEHELSPRIPSLDAQLTETIQLQESMSFYQVAQISGAPLDIIEKLNPAYAFSFIPAYPRKGRNLTLPKRNMKLFKAYLEADRPDEEKKEVIASAPVFISHPKSTIKRAYEEQSYTLHAGESLDVLANQLKIPTVQIMSWNGLKEKVFTEDQQVMVYIPIPPKQNPMNVTFIPLEPIGPAKILAKQELASLEENQSSIWEEEIDRFLFQDEFLFYWAPKREKVSEIAEKLPGISKEEIIELNKFKKDKVIKPNAKIKIKKLGK